LPPYGPAARPFSGRNIGPIHGGDLAIRGRFTSACRGY